MDPDTIQTQHLFYNFFKKNPIKALELAHRDEELTNNEIIGNYRAQFQRTGFRIFRDMSMMMIFIKVCTNLAHHRRSLALSAPRTFTSALIKYTLLPGLITFCFERDRYECLISNVEDLKDG